MSIIDTKNLPAPIVAAIRNDEHVSQGSDIGASTVGAPVQQVALRNRHRGEIVEEASDRIWSLLGQAVHTVLERAAKTADTNAFETFVEERWETTVLGWRVAARCDHLTMEGDGTLTDYKVSSVWSVKDGAKDEWVSQLNVTRYIAHAARGLNPKALQAVVILRDWRKNERLRYGNEYPEQQIATVPIPLWSLDQARAYLENRIAMHQAARNGGTPPPCTPGERWERPTTYAVTKAGRKTAVRLYDTRAKADEHARTQPDLSVVVRPGQSVRCASYCDVLPFCSQGQKLVAEEKACALIASKEVGRG